MVIVVIGGSGGIGLGVVKQALKRFPDAVVYGTYYRHPPEFRDQRLIWSHLDVASESEIKLFSEQFPSVDILVNAVGILHIASHRPEKSVQEFDPAFFQKNITTNVAPSLLLAKHFQKKLKSQKTAFFVAISARVGSIGDNQLGGWISYRTSKAALNMALKTLSIEWKRTVPECCVLLFHPGTTDSGLSRPFQRNVPKEKLHAPESTAGALLNLLENISPAQTGHFLSYDGQEIEW